MTPLPKPTEATFLRGDNMRNALLDFARRTQDNNPELSVLILDPQRPKGYVLEIYRRHAKPILTHHPEDTLPEADLIIKLR